MESSLNKAKVGKDKILSDVLETMTRTWTLRDVEVVPLETRVILALLCKDER